MLTTCKINFPTIFIIVTDIPRQNEVIFAFHLHIWKISDISSLIYLNNYDSRKHCVYE